MPLAIRIIVYPAFLIITFFIFVLALFPFDSIRLRTASELENALGGAYEIKIDSMSPSLLTGVWLKGVSMTPRKVADAIPYKIKKAKIKVALSPLLSGLFEIDFDVIAEKGTAKGEFSWKKGFYNIKIKTDKLDLGLFSALLSQSGMSFSGMINGNVSLAINEEDPLSNQGSIHLQFPELVLGEMATTDGSFKIPALKLAQLTGSPATVDTEITKGNIDLSGLKFSGGDLEIAMDGKIYGAKKWDNYRFNLKGAFKVVKEVADQVPVLALVDKQKQSDGQFPLTLTGRVVCPNIRVGEFKIPLACTP
ncbi:MAG: type II secretion system protein GspN [Deltaproteobacteria bacterium]|nr:MAG: type II secretion system protein GspN [Deltaproteobacteria bacterium]